MNIIEIVHRDIKAGNILLSEDGMVKLADFGLSVKVTNTEHGEGVNGIAGTKHFLAPEVCIRRERRQEEERRTREEEKI